MEDVVDPATLKQLQLIYFHVSYSFDNLVWSIEVMLQFLYTTVLQETLFLGLQLEKDRIHNLKATLHHVPFFIHFLLILTELQFFLQDSQDVSTLLQPIFGLGGPSPPKFHIYE
jgi:hypothetical protein